MIDIIIEKHDLNQSPKKVCPFCQSNIISKEGIVNCPKCNIPHHKECWIENGGCSIFGCGYQRGVEYQERSVGRRQSFSPILSFSPFREDNLGINLLQDDRRKKRLKLVLLFLFAYTITCIIFLVSNWQADRSINYVLPKKSIQEETRRSSEYEKKEEDKPSKDYSSPVTEYRELYKTRFGSHDDYGSKK